ncbi:hypothetical protein [Chryseobacterium sp.]|uniref:hypothetical protein n=1 Tax=Chryseobacterium sp. TaxID=1871047 RepID=UPI003219CADD
MNIQQFQFLELLFYFVLADHVDFADVATLTRLKRKILLMMECFYSLADHTDFADDDENLSYEGK